LGCVTAVLERVDWSNCELNFSIEPVVIDRKIDLTTDRSGQISVIRISRQSDLNHMDKSSGQNPETVESPMKYRISRSFDNACCGDGGNFGR
jgi:hypothetical protein